ncbi:MAG TPA: pitrilysin family protein [Bryobacteraceae bacterium]|jgi:zinc protease|nr:pitrilysin family protein [Bryobacteraceae bacterium]
MRTRSAARRGFRRCRIVSFAALTILGTPLPGQTPPKPAAKPPAARPSLPSYRDLKYPPLRPIQIPAVDTFTLPNGMKLYLLEDHELPVVNGTALVRTGNLFDPPDKIGLATLTGMVMRTGGTKAKTGEQLDEQLENLAASVESSIGESSGSVGFSCLKENTGEVLAAFKEVLANPEFRQEKVDLAKTQIRSSISRRNDDAHGIAQREFTNTVYGKDTPYGWDEEYATIDRIKRGDLQTFYKRYFFPANVMLAVRGDFDTSAMKARIEKLFADWTVGQQPVPEFPKVGPPPPGGTYLAVKKDVTQTFFAVGQQGGELLDKDYPALEIMGDILGGGFQSRLVERIRTKMGNAYDISADWGAGYDHPGLFEISGSTKSISTVETLKAIREEVDRIRTTEVTEEELRTAKDTALNSLVFAFDTRAKTLGRLLTYEYYGYPKDFIQQYQKALGAVTRADILRAAKEHLDPARFTILAVGNPQDFGQPLDSLGSPAVAIDLTIPPPKPETAQADASTMEMGKQLLARVQQAVGGADKLAAVKDSTEVADFLLGPAAGSVHVKQTDRWIAPTCFRQESETPAGRISAYWDGQNGWLAAPQGTGVLAGAQLKQVQGDLFRLYFRLLLSDRIEGRTVNAAADDTIEISDASGEIARVVVNSDGLPASVLYDAVRMAGPPVAVEEDFSDFREVAGIKVPYVVRIVQGGQKFADVTVTDFRVNTGLKVQDLGKRP